MSVLRSGAVALACIIATNLAVAEERRIEEIVVTAEKRESTVSDTSISITAFGEDAIEDFGLQGADELVNFIPATTRDAYDIRIRGVGRNFRALGGDPGVATYYNGVYSEDFGIAASENGLYDVERIEALRGPQGTLYGRNSIGGALNYITNKPTYEFEGELRTMMGNLNTKEYYGILSGPIIEDTLAMRVVGVMRDREGSTEGLGVSRDVNSINDENFSIALNWNISDNWEANLRWNDRSSDRIIGRPTVNNEGPLGARGFRDTTNFARGLRPVAAGTPGALEFIHPVTGASVYGAFNRAGVDGAATHVANAAYGASGAALHLERDLDDVDARTSNNGDENEKFDQNAIQFDLTWDINETTSLKYLGGWMDFDYTFDLSNSLIRSDLVQDRSTVLEAVETFSHELQLLWQIGDNLQMTSGIYYFNSDRLQNFAFRDTASQGKYTNPAIYGGMAGFNPFIFTPGVTSHVRRGAAPVGGQVVGPWEGDPTGGFYEYWNTVETDATAVYTQGTYTFNENWALTIGVRWAEDEKEAFEDRTGYFELNPDLFASALFGGALTAACDGAIGIFFGTTCAGLGLTSNLAIANIFMGAASPSFTAGQIVPTCAFDATTCATPLRLQGVPYSFADSAAGDDDWGDTSWRVNLDWTPNEDTLVYISATTGYRSGGYSLGIGDSRGVAPGGLSGTVPLTYDQEEVIAGEIGYKGTLLDGRLQVNLSAYMYQYDDYQDRIDIFNEVLGSSQDQVRNADEATNQGIEVEFMWLATDNLTLGGNASYTKTEYDSDLFVQENDNPAYPITLFTNRVNPDGTPGPDAFIVRNLKGNELKRIPEWKATIWSSYQWTFSSGTLTAGMTWSYTGEFYDTGIERDLDLIPERDRLDLSLTWRDNREQWTVRAFVDNALDNAGIRGIGTSTASGNWRQTSDVLYPRFYGLDVTFRFGAY